ncbi:hypothetical protein ACIBAG_35740 [Streptomyces sp. NPDC051243]|uniref:hypothetical protein n=1 Tax=Streptomyces sp. NPDC051243 TaxID=3365646 RepID=UPI00378AC753
MIKIEGVAVSGTDEPDFSGLGGGEERAAEDAVQEVVNWYNTQIITERRAPVPDDERIEELRPAVRPHSPIKRSWRPPTRRRLSESPPFMRRA